MTRWRPLRALLAASLAVNASVPATAQRSSPPSRPAPAADPGPASETHRISAGDVLFIEIFPVDEYNREVTVQPDGSVDLPLIGSVPVSGLTPQELPAFLEQKFSRYVDKPRVSVSVRRFSSRRVAILGEVKSPGYYEYRDGMSLLDLVALSGGLSEAAKPSKTTLIRRGSTQGSIRVNLRAVLEGDLSRDLPIQPGDIVSVPKGAASKAGTYASSNILPWTSILSSIGLLITTALLIRETR